MSEEKSLISTLPPEKSRFCMLYLTGNYSIPKLAKALNKHESTLRKWLKLPEVKEVINDLQREQEEYNKNQLKALSAEALNVMHELMDSAMDGVRYQAAKDILDRSGYKPTQKTEKKVEVYSIEQSMKDIIDKTIEAEYYEVIE